MADTPETQTCKRSVELEASAAEVQAETAKVIEKIQKKVKIPGFRPGKTPIGILKSRFASDIRQEVVDEIVPAKFNAHAKSLGLNVVGQAKVVDLHFHEGEAVHFKIEFEVAPEFDLGEYRGLTAPYAEPAVEASDVEERLERLREQKADYVNLDPRPLEDGDFVSLALRSTAGLEGKPLESDDMNLHLGAKETMPEFNEHLQGMSPGESKEITIAYPGNYASARLAGKSVTFEVTVKAVRRKELPELDDDFAQDVGDFKTLEELQSEVRRSILRERESEANETAKAKLIDALVDAHEFPLPDAWVDKQVDMNLESRVREFAMQGIDPRTMNIDWREVREQMKPQAARDVKASLLLEKIGDREAIETMQDDVDREVVRIAKQTREMPAAVRMKLEKDGTLGRIAARIRTEKVLNFLFEHSRKVAPAPNENADAAAEG